jgi:hypothetical protein
MTLTYVTRKQGGHRASSRGAAFSSPKIDATIRILMT